MRGRFLVPLVGLFLVAGCSDTIRVGEPPNTEGITVVATGTADVVPDIVRVSFSVSVLADTNDAALEQASKITGTVRDTLTKRSVEAADVSTQTLNVNPEYDYSGPDGQRLIGYRASQYIDVIVRAADQAGSIIDDVVKAGGNEVSVGSAYPSVDDATKGAAVAREDAIAKARVNAEQYAKLLGVQLGDLVYVTETSAPPYGQPSYEGADRGLGAGTIIDLGRQQVTVTVEVRWRISGA